MPDDDEQYYNDFALRMTEFMGAIRNRAGARHLRGDQPRCHERRLLQGADALQKLFDFEQERLNYDPQSLPKHASSY